MEPIRLIAMDMDGTLLADDGKGILPEDAQALRLAHEAGIHLALCSGRVPDDMSFYARDMDLPMHILALNGTCILDKPMGQIVRSQYIPEYAARGIFRLLQGKPVAYAMFGDHDLIVSPPSMSRQELEIIFGSNILREGTRTVIHCGSEGAGECIRRGMNKMMIFTENDPQPLQEIRSHMEKFFPSVEVSSSWVNNLEVNPLGVNKGSALSALAQMLDIPMTQVMAIGDNDNDIPMLSAAGIGVAMGNATPAARAAADYLTLPNSQCGVSAAIRALALGSDSPGVRRLT